LDRQTIYFGQIPLETDLLHAQQNALVALAKLASGVLGAVTNVNGFTCTPTTPASLSVVLTTGEIYQVENLEGSAWSSLPADLVDSIVKQGIQLPNLTFGITPPATFGFSQIYLLEVQYQDLDTGLVTLPYFNAAAPSSPFMGPGNSGTAQNTVRQGAVAAQLKAGIAAPTGTQVAPTADAGWTGLFLITVAQGATTITAGNITQILTAPFIPVTLPNVPAGVRNGLWLYANDIGVANAYAAAVFPIPASLVAGMGVRIKIANPNSGASTFNLNGLGTNPIIRASGAAVTTGDILANEVLALLFDGANWQIENYIGFGSGGTNNFFSATGLPYCVDSSVTPSVITAPFSPIITAPSLVGGLTVEVKLANTVTGPTTITVNSLPTKNVVNPDGSPIQNGQFQVGEVLLLIYDGVQFQAGWPQERINNLQVLTASGTYTPTAGTRKALVIATGAGGAGGVALSCAGGAGAGLTAIVLVTITGTVVCTIGAGGIGTTASPSGSAVGGNGGTTSFGAFAIAPGGQGGPGEDLGGHGGLAAGGTGTMLINGGDGMTSYSGSGFGSGNGGPSFWGGGGSGYSFTENLGGHAGQAYGSGGGGADSGAGNRTGGNGAPGVILVLEF
jgi:hypothetical protein